MLEVIWIPVLAFIGCACILAALACITCGRRRNNRRRLLQLQQQARSVVEMQDMRGRPPGRWQPNSACIICADSPAVFTFPMCGHRIACLSCAAANGLNCPLCVLGAPMLNVGTRPSEPPPMTNDSQVPVDLLVAAKLKRVDEEESYLQRNPGKEAASMPEGAYPALSGKMPMCIICFERAAGHIFIPCGHLCCCDICVDQISARCPYCNQEFQQKLKVFSDL